MYIKNYYSNSISEVQFVPYHNIEVINLEKKPGYIRMWVKVDNQNYKIIIFKEKNTFKFIVFDQFHNYNVYQFLFSVDKGREDNNNIICEGDYYFVVSPLSGRIEKISDEIKKGDPIVIISAMKMEHLIIADRDYQIVEKIANVGQFVNINQKILKLKPKNLD